MPEGVQELAIQNATISISLSLFRFTKGSTSAAQD
jgi:hypothetical protein